MGEPPNLTIQFIALQGKTDDVKEKKVATTGMTSSNGNAAEHGSNVEQLEHGTVIQEHMDVARMKRRCQSRRSLSDRCLV